MNHKKELLRGLWGVDFAIPQIGGTLVVGRVSALQIMESRVVGLSLAVPRTYASDYAVCYFR